MNVELVTSFGQKFMHYRTTLEMVAVLNIGYHNPFLIAQDVLTITERGTTSSPHSYQITKSSANKSVKFDILTLRQ